MPSVYLIRFLSPEGEEWAEMNLADAERAFGGVAVEWRYMEPILDGMEKDGLIEGQDFEISA